MNGRFGAVLRAIGALACSLALIVGVPLVLLAAVGNPFPSSLPSFGEVETVLTQNGQGFSEFVLSVLAIIVWFVWAQLIVAFAFELVYAARGRETPRLPTAPGVQSLAARLVTSMTLAATLAVAPLLAPAAGALHFDEAPRGSSAVAGPIAHTSPVVAPSVAVGSGAAAGESMIETEIAADADLVLQAEPSTTVSLEADTELWDLSEAAYGDGVRWKLIAAANAGTQDAAGVRITNETEVVSAGTSLALPGDPQMAGLQAFGVRVELADQVVDMPAAETTHLVAPGDSMWSVAEAEVANRLGRAPSEAEVADYWFDVVHANGAVSSGNPDLIYPGEVLAMPGHLAATPEVALAEVEITEAPISEAADSEAAASEAEIAGGTLADGGSTNEAGEPSDRTEAGQHAGDSEALAESSAESSSGSSDESPLLAPEAPIGSRAEAAGPAVAPEQARAGLPARELAVAAFGSALFASGVVAAIKRRRDLQRRLRAPGVALPTASTEAAQLELALRHRSSQVIESTQGGNWRLLPVQAVVDLRAPSARELRVDPEHGTTIVEPVEPVEASRAGEPSAGAAQLTTDRAAAGAELVDIVEAAPSALIVGTDPVSGEAVLLDLERASTISLIGSATEVRRFAQSAVLDLAVSDRAADLCVVAVGIAADLDDLERVQCVDSMAAALVAAVHCGHATAGPDSQLGETHGLVTPLVVVATAEPIDDADAVDALVELGAIVLGPGLDADVRITLRGDRAHLWPTGTTALVAALPADDFDAVAELVEVTSVANARPRSFPSEGTVVVEDASQPHVQAEISDALDLSDAVDRPTSPPHVPPDPGPLEVQVLGPVDVVGAKSFSSVKAVDVIAYLAFHRNGVDADQIRTWVWPGFDPPTNKAFANVMSRARAGLGVDADGEPYLSKAGADKTYRLASTVTTDFERFQILVERADSTGDLEFELEYLRQALDLIRGVPFTGGSVTSFAWADNHVRAHVEFSIDEAVHRCADLALSLNDLATARWAALKGLELVPGCEQCFRRRFLVAGAGSNRTELRRAMADLERITAAELGEPEAVDLISEDLLSLYHGLDRQLVAASMHEPGL